MSLFEIMLIALGLAMDAFAVSVANGVIIREVKISHAIRFGLYFGIFQFAMPLIGWLIGMTFVDYIAVIDHWVAFVLLSFIGVNMLMDALAKDKNPIELRHNSEIMKWQNMTMMAIATSIDALAVGISFAVIYTDIIVSAVIIGVIAFIMSMLGVLLGKSLGRLFRRGAEIVGGLILIIIGTKILIEHLIY